MTRPLFSHDPVACDNRRCEHPNCRFYWAGYDQGFRRGYFYGFTAGRTGTGGPDVEQPW